MSKMESKTKEPSESDILAELSGLLTQLADVRHQKESAGSGQQVVEKLLSPQSGVPAFISSAQAGSSSKQSRVIMVSHLLPVNVNGHERTLSLSTPKSTDQLTRALLAWHSSQYAYEETAQHSGSNANFNAVWVGGIVTDGSPWARSQDMFLVERKMVAVDIPADRHNLHYNGFCLSVLWPMLHSSMQSMEYTFKAHEGSMESYQHVLLNAETSMTTEAAMFDAYEGVCRQFAESIKAVYRPGDVIVINDYQLMLLPRLLRQRLPHANIVFFLHSPFPSSEVYRPSTFREVLLESMLAADYVGFQTQDYLRHFLSACIRICGADATPRQIIYGERKTKLLVQSMGIHVETMLQGARSSRCTAKLKEIQRVYPGVKIVLGVDTSDSMSGVLSKFQIFEHYLQTNKADIGKVILIQVTEPAPAASLADTSSQNLASVNESIGRINGLYGRIPQSEGSFMGGPVFNIVEPPDVTDLLALYAAADVLLVTSHRDGMNLSPNEYVACRNTHGQLASVIVSEFAGCAQTLQGSFMVNPHNTEEAVTVLRTALHLSRDGAMERHARLWKQVKAQTIGGWLSFLVHSARNADDTSGGASAKTARKSLLVEDGQHSVQATQQRIVLLDGDNIVGKTPEEASAAIDKLERAAASAHNRLVICSAASPEEMSTLYGDMPAVLVAEDGAYVRWIPCAQWVPFASVSTAEWMDDVLPLLSYFTERTPGSRIIRNKATATWDYRDAEPEFAVQQARDLSSALAEFTTHTPMVVASSRFGCVDIRPAGSNKAMILYKLISLMNSGRPLFEAQHALMTPRQLVAMELRQDAEYWSRSMPGLGDKLSGKDVNLAEEMIALFHKQYNKIFSMDPCDAVVVMSSGWNRLDEDLIALLQTQHRLASTNVTMELLQHPSDSKISSELGDHVRLTMVPPPKPIEAYAATRAPSTVTLPTSPPFKSIHPARPHGYARHRVDTSDDMLGLLPMIGRRELSRFDGFDTSASMFPTSLPSEGASVAGDTDGASTFRTHSFEDLFAHAREGAETLPSESVFLSPVGNSTGRRVAALFDVVVRNSPYGATSMASYEIESGEDVRDLLIPLLADS